MAKQTQSKDMRYDFLDSNLSWMSETMFTRLSELVEPTIPDHNGINQFKDFAVWKCSQ